MIKTSRLEFKPLSLDHLNDFFDLESDPEVLKYYRRPVVQNLEEAKKNLLNYVEYGDKHPGLGAFSVFLKEGNIFIGIGVLIHLDKDPSSKDYELGYRLQRKHWGKGYATEIAQGLLGYASQSRNLTEIFGTTHPDNLASQQVLLKVGFQYLKDVHVHGGPCKLYKRELT